MWYIDWIIKIGAAVTAITGLAMVIRKIINFFRNLSNRINTTIKYVEKNIDEVNKIDEIERHTRENYLMCLRLTIMNREMPIGERIVAGKTYITEGGNGEVKKYCEQELHINEVHNN